MPVRKHRRDSSEVSCCLKYIIFGFNVMFWVLGLGILAVGVWAWTEKDTFNNLSRLTHIALDPAFVLILIGTLTFIIGFTGCVGALRENTCLLAGYAVFLALLLLSEMTVGILGFVFKDWIKAQATGGLQAFIINYREDPDQQNLIDWIQEDWLQCCGIEGPKDWDLNNYFNCSSQWRNDMYPSGAVASAKSGPRIGTGASREGGSREACGVPFSCCRRKPNEIIKNKQCGYDVRKPGYNYDMAKIIYEKGCVQAGEEWIERNLLILACSAVTIAFVQILGICFAQNLRADIFAQKAKWH